MDIEGTIRLADLLPGDMCNVAGSAERYVYLGKMDHPIFPQMQLVIWWQWDRGYVLDALSPLQVLPMTTLKRYPQNSDTIALLKVALLSWQQSGASLRPPA